MMKKFAVEIAGYQLTINEDGTILEGKNIPNWWVGEKIQDSPWSTEGYWRNIMGRPVLIHRTGRICGGKIPKEWQGQYLQDKPWADLDQLEQEFLETEQKKFEQQKLAEAKQFRQLIMEMGGVKIDDDYEYLPVWCRRKNGQRLDELVDEVAIFGGFPVNDANDLYEMLFEYSPSDKGKMKKGRK